MHAIRLQDETIPHDPHSILFSIWGLYNQTKNLFITAASWWLEGIGAALTSCSHQILKTNSIKVLESRSAVNHATLIIAKYLRFTGSLPWKYGLCYLELNFCCASHIIDSSCFFFPKISSVWNWNFCDNSSTTCQVSPINRIITVNQTGICAKQGLNTNQLDRSLTWKIFNYWLKRLFISL